MNVRQLFDLSGKTAIVTGGSRGLGLQIAEALGEMGASVAITARKQEELDEAVKHLAAEIEEVADAHLTRSPSRSTFARSVTQVSCAHLK